MRMAKTGPAIVCVGVASLLAGCAGTGGRQVASRPSAAPQRPAQPQAPAPTRPVAAINANLSANEALWHLRSALNVAALSCRAKSVSGVAPAYNRMLNRHKAMLAAANAAEMAPFRARYGAKWAGPYDAHATKLYNFFAMPTAQAQFCVTASQVLARANAMAPDAMPGYAPAALAALESPFLKRQGYARR